MFPLSIVLQLHAFSVFLLVSEKRTSSFFLVSFVENRLSWNKLAQHANKVFGAGLALHLSHGLVEKMDIVNGFSGLSLVAAPPHGGLQPQSTLGQPSHAFARLWVVVMYCLGIGDGGFGWGAANPFIYIYILSRVLDKALSSPDRRV